MSKPYLLGLSLSERRESVPRLDQRVRIAAKRGWLIWQSIVDVIGDNIHPGEDRLPGETRTQYVYRNDGPRQNEIGWEIDSYVLDKQFGTEATRNYIEIRRGLED